MTGIYLILMIVLAAMLSWAVTLLIKRRASKLGLLQTPNERSSHSQPTPSGGGVGAAIAGVLACLLLSLSASASFAALALLLGAIATLGFIDDIRDLPARLRLGVQIVVVSMLLGVVAPVAPITLSAEVAITSPWLWAILLLGGMWWLNLFNFMDGIDGLAGSQAILILLGGAAIWLLKDASAADQPGFVLALLVAAAAAGFLIQNWPPARIFMGDAGSNFLALSIFAVTLLAVSAGGPSYPSWLVLAGAFVSDATVTLFRRMARGEKPWVAHRRHAYQRLSRTLGHLPATLAYGAVTLLVLAPLAWLADAAGQAGWVVVLVTYALLGVLMIRLGAGAAV